MSDKSLVRRTKIQVTFAGVDISADLKKYFLSMSYTDNEADETDDLQIKLEDREGVWLCKWLNTAIQAAAASPPSSTQNTYTVTAGGGLNVRSGPGTSYSKLGTLDYGAEVSVSSVKEGWAVISYSGKTAYVSMEYLRAVSRGRDSSGAWKVGEAVVASGRPQYSSEGSGAPGDAVSEYHGTITYLNLQAGVPYPIHVDQLGWFAESQVRPIGETEREDGGESGIKGMHIQAAIIRENWNSDGKDGVLECGSFELDGVEASGPPSVIVIKGTSLPYRSTVRQTKKSKAWEEYTLSGIAREMAAKNGMACMFEAAEDPWISRAEQVNQSDIAFLQALCNRYGISLKATANILILFDQAAYEKKPAVKIITRGKAGGYIKYKLRTGENDTQYGACHVSYTDPSGKTIEYTHTLEDADEDSQTLEIRQKVRSVSEAKALAEKMLRLKNKYEYSADFTFPGDPALVAGLAVELRDFGAFSGKYLISQAKHAVSGSGYTVNIKLRKVLEGY